MAAPTIPQILAPLAGEVISGTYLVQWSEGTIPDVVAPSFIASAAQVFAPTVAPGAAPGVVAPSFIASAAQVFQPTVAAGSAGGDAFALEFSGSGAGLRSSTENATLSALTEHVSILMRFRGDFVTELASVWDGLGPLLCALGSTAGGDEKLYFQIADWGEPVRFVIVNSDGSVNNAADLDRAAFTAAGWYRAYAALSRTDPAASVVAVYQDDGTLIGDNGSGFSTGGAQPAGGYVTMGGSGKAALTGAIDYLAIYDAPLTGADRYRTPTAADAGLVQLNLMDEGSGTTAGASVGVDLDVATGTLAWVANT